LGLLFDNPSPGYMANVQLGAITQCRAEGYHLMIEPVQLEAPDLSGTVEAVLTTLRLDGVILTPPVSDDPTVLATLEASGTPYVRIAPYVDRDRASYVHMDDAGAAYEMTQRLLKLGHRDIGFIKGHPEHGATHLRFDGYCAALTEHGLEVRPELVQQGYFSFTSGRECAEAMLSGPRPPTAVFASNDDMALGVISVASRMGLHLPDDLSVAGFDDAPSAEVVWPPLTTVRQPIAEMASAAAQILISRRWRAEDGSPTNQMLDFEIVTRNSTTKPKRGSDAGASHHQFAGA
jgi:LacI family transcriptional regulator